MDPYQLRVFEGASGVELTVALYEGIIRFMNKAIVAVERGEVDQRRIAVKRAMDIVIHLQATLQMDIGGEPAKALSEFYVAMFALMLQGSQANSIEKFRQVIACVRNVRGAWRHVANNSEVNPIPAPPSGLPSRRMQLSIENTHSSTNPPAGSSWSA